MPVPTWFTSETICAASTLVAASAAYTYRYPIVRNGLIAYAHFRDLVETRSFAFAVLNDDGKLPCSDGASETEGGSGIGEAVCLFPHIESVELVYVDGTAGATRLTEAQAEVLEVALRQWRVFPVAGNRQRVCLYDLARAAFTAHVAPRGFPDAIHVTCDTMLMDLTHTDAVVVPCDADGTLLRLSSDVTNELSWASEPVVVDAPSPTSVEPGLI